MRARTRSVMLAAAVGVVPAVAQASPAAPGAAHLAPGVVVAADAAALPATSTPTRAGERAPAIGTADGAEAGAVAAPGAAPPSLPLSARVPAVSRHAITRAGRLELALGVGTSFNDPSLRYVLPALAARYHLAEAWAAGLAVGAYPAIQTWVPVAGGGLAQPALNRPVLSLRAEGAWAPIYGKFSWLAEGVSHFDAGISAGVGMIVNRDGGTVPTAMLGVATHVFFVPTLALTLGLRGELFSLPRVAAGRASALTALFSAAVGLSFWLPLAAPEAP